MLHYTLISVNCKPGEPAPCEECSLVRQIAGCNLVSFDVFDTLILRAVSKPTDVFSLVRLKLLSRCETLLHPDVVDAFPVLRVEAERLAREAKRAEQANDEVTLDDIYAHLARLTSTDSDWLSILRQTELDLEMHLAFPNPAVSQVWSTALGLGKTVVLCSDMYLPSGFVARLLEKCGFFQYQELYVSCEHARSKHEGTLFNYIAGRHGVSTNLILHIGDNAHSDFAMPIKAGCKAVLLVSAHSAGEPALSFDKEKPSLGTEAIRSAVLGVTRKRALTRPFSDPWERLGYEVFGPLFTGFLLWLASMAQRIRPEKILLFARDTYFLKQHLHRFLQPLGLNPEVSYLYVSRASLLLASFTDFPLTRLWHLFSGRSQVTVRDHLHRLGLNPETFSPVVASAGFDSLSELVPSDDLRMHSLLAKLHRPLLLEGARRRPLVRRYLEPFVGSARSLMVVDVGWVGNMQASFLRLLGPLTGSLRVRGCYMGLYNQARENDYPGQTMEGWLLHYGDGPNLQKEVFWAGGVELLEFAMCAPHGTTLGYVESESGEVAAVLEESQSDTQIRALSARLHVGAAQFMDDFLETFECMPANALSSRAWAQQFYRLVTQPTLEETELLGDVTHCDSFGDTRRRLPIAPRLTAKDEDAIATGLDQSYWKAGFMVRNGLTNDAGK